MEARRNALKTEHRPSVDLYRKCQPYSANSVTMETYFSMIYRCSLDNEDSRRVENMARVNVISVRENSLALRTGIMHVIDCRINVSELRKDWILWIKLAELSRTAN